MDIHPRAFPLIVLLSTAAWLEWDRFRARTPSLIDDWYAIAYSRKALHALLQGDYSSAAVDFSGRYRPSYSAIWNYTQWHLLGSPSVTTAAAWGFVRVVFFLMAIWFLAAWLIKRQASPGPSLVGLAPLAVAVTPAIAVDLTRQSTNEPMMIGGLICGLALVGAGVQKILANPGLSRPGMAMAALGYLVYLFGVYSLDDPLPDQDAASGTPWVPVVRLRPPRRLIDPPRLFGTTRHESPPAVGTRDQSAALVAMLANHAVRQLEEPSTREERVSQGG